MPRHNVLLPISLLFIAMLSIQSGASLAKSLFPVIGPEGTTTLRLVLGALILLVVMRPWRSPISRASLPSVVAYGLALGGMNLMFYMSLQRIPLGIAVALEFTGPLALALLSSRRALDFLWVALAVFGLYLLLPSEAAHSNLDPIGVALALGAGVSWAAYIIYGQRAGTALGSHAVAWGTIVAALAVMPIGIWQNGVALLNVNILPIAFAVAVLSSALPYTLEMVALTRLPARTFSTLMSLEPAIAAMCGLLFLGETLTATQWLAAGAIVAASAGTALTIRPKRPVGDPG